MELLALQEASAVRRLELGHQLEERQARLALLTASRRVLSRVTFPVVRHSTVDRTGPGTRRPPTEEPPVEWLVPTPPVLVLLRGRPFSLSSRRDSPSGESFLFHVLILHGD